VRFSLSRFTTAGEIETTVAILREVCSLSRAALTV
jgi:cysteine sulfinate desulfinase/cysteine desulfurase-like protein